MAAVSGETHDRAVRVETQMGYCRERCNERHGFTVEALEKHEARLVNIEKLVWKVAGGAMVGGTIGGVATQLFVRWIGGH